jgi:hypothetical protein
LCFLDVLNDLVTTGKVPKGIDDSMKECDNLEIDTDWLVLNTTAPQKDEKRQFSLLLGQELVTLPGGLIPGVACEE